MKRVIGGILIVVGLALAVYGGYLGAVYTTGGAQPHYITAIVCFWGGVIVAGIGMALCGIIDWARLWEGF